MAFRNSNINIILFTLGLAIVPAADGASIAAGKQHTCLTTVEGEVRCFGLNDRGQLGIGPQPTWGNHTTDMGGNLLATPLGSGGVKNVVSGERHSCALFADGRVKCWGANDKGQLGQGHTREIGRNSNEMGERLPFLDFGGEKATSLSAGADHTCAILQNSSVRCWGANDLCQLGLGRSGNRGDEPNEMGPRLPIVELGSGERAKSIAAGTGFTCAALESGKVKCWGGNHDGQLGLGDLEMRGCSVFQMGERLPAIDFGIDEKAVRVAAGLRHACALFESGRVKCWGFNVYGALGLGDALNRGQSPQSMGANLPFLDLEPGLPVANLTCSYLRCCAVFSNGTAKCWGSDSGGNVNGLLGLGDAGNRGDEPSEMGVFLPFLDLGTLASPTEIAIGESHVCAGLASGEIKCWGDNSVGQIGAGDEEARGVRVLRSRDGTAMKWYPMGDGLAAVDIGPGGR